MSSRTREDIYYKIFKNPYDFLSENKIDLSKLVIPFSKLFKTENLRDIYSGNEKIPFKERELNYKIIMKQEFSNLLKSTF